MQEDTAAAATPEDQVLKRVAWLNMRWLIALAGIVLSIAGQFQLASDRPSPGTPLPLGIWLNEQIHLGDPSVDNVLNGFLILLAGGALLAVALRGIRLLPAAAETFGSATFQRPTISSTWPWILGGTGAFAVLLFRVTSDEFRLFQAPVWLSSLIIFGAVAASWDRQHGTDLSPHLDRKDWLWIFGLTLAGILIGAYRLQGIPDQLIGDEGSFWTIARDIARGEFQPSIFASGVYTFPVFSSILQGWIIRAFGIDLWGWRFSSVLMGILTLPPLYLLVRDAFDRKIAIASCAVLITSPYLQAFSRLGYNNIQSLFFTTLTLYWLYTGLGRKSNLYLYLAGCAAGLGFYTYFAARFAILISLAFIFLIWLGRKIKFRDAAQSVGLLAIGFLLVITPYFVYGYNRDPEGMGYKTWESVFINTFNGLQFYSEEELFAVAPPFEVNDNQLFYNPEVYTVLITRGILRTLLVFQKAGIISEHYIAFPLTGSIGALFYLAGLVLVLWTLKQPRSLLLILWFLANVLGLSALNTVPPRHTHMVTIIPVLAVLTGMGLNAIAVAAASMHFKLTKLRTVFLAVLVVLAGAGGLYDFFVRMPAQYLPQPDQVISWAELDSNGENFIYLYSDPAEKDLYPYVAEEFRENVPYAAVDASEVFSGQRQFTDQPTLIFFRVDIAEDAIAAMQEQWGDRLISRTFYSTNGTPILAAAMNTPFVFERDKDFPTTLRDSYQRPTFWWLLIALGLCLAGGAALPAAWSLKAPRPLKRLADWFNAPGQPAPEPEEHSEWTEEVLLASRQIPKPVASDPPEWALDTTSGAKKEPVSKSRFSASLQHNKNEQGTDYFFKLHIPRLALPSLDLSRFQRADGTSPLSLPPLHIPGAAWLIGSIILAVTAQFLIGNERTSLGILAYLISVAGLITWARLNPGWRNVFVNQLRLSPRMELYLFAAVIILTISTRFFDLNYRVYGLEADETKWTVQSWYSAILQVDLGEFSGMHYQHLPVDFWLRSFFLRIYGLNFISARIESAVLGLIAVACLYFIVRLLTRNPPAALLSSLLYSFSFIELNASHQALHDTHPAAWMMSSLMFLVWGVRERKTWQFQVSGVLLALGMLTYETFYPTPMIALLYLSGLAVIELKQRTESARNWVKIMAIVFWPVALVYFTFTHTYLVEQAYHFEELTGAATGGFWHTVVFVFQNMGYILNTTFVYVNWTDSLINWAGPILNPAVLPFVVIGFIYNLWNIRRPHYAFILLWYVGQIAPAPIMLGSVWPRVLYTATAPLMVWAALGLWTTFAGIRALLDKWSRPLAAPVFALLIAGIVISDYHIFSSVLTDPIERQKRRELASLVETSAGSTPMLLLPYIPDQNDSIEVESHVLIYAVAGGGGYGLDAADHYSLVELDHILPTLWEWRDRGDLDVIFDHTADTRQEFRNAVLASVRTCYPGSELKTSGRFFHVYRLDARALSSPTCYSPSAPLAVSPSDSAVRNSSRPVTFTWETDNSSVDGFQLTLEHKPEGVHWIEVEDGFTGTGWPAVSAFVEDYHGTGFLLDDWQAGEAVYTYELPEQAEYRIWVRSYKRRVNDQHNFIALGGQKFEFALDDDALYEWVWRQVGSLDLPSGPLPITLSRTYGEDEQYSVFVDTVVITSDPGFNPEVDSIWETVLTTPEIHSSAREFTTREALPPGEYRWRVRIYDDDRIVDFTGARGVESPAAVFRVEP